MSNKSHEERVEQSKRNAAKKLAEKGILQLRMEPAVLEELYNLATDRKMRYTDMVRDWIVFELQKAKTGIENPSEFDVMNLTALLNDTVQQMTFMREEIDQLKVNQQTIGIDWGIAAKAPSPPAGAMLGKTKAQAVQQSMPPKMPGVDSDWYAQPQAAQDLPAIEGNIAQTAPSAQQAATAELSGIVLVKDSNASSPEPSKEQLKKRK